VTETVISISYLDSEEGQKNSDIHFANSIYIYTVHIMMFTTCTFICRHFYFPNEKHD
jgi:hypothetical protein